MFHGACASVRTILGAKAFAFLQMGRSIPIGVHLQLYENDILATFLLRCAFGKFDTEAKSKKGK